MLTSSDLFVEAHVVHSFPLLSTASHYYFPSPFFFLIFILKFQLFYPNWLKC